MIYFVQCGADGPIKIGLTGKSIKSRLSALQTANPEPLKVVGLLAVAENRSLSDQTGVLIAEALQARATAVAEAANPLLSLSSYYLRNHKDT